MCVHTLCVISMLSVLQVRDSGLVKQPGVGLLQREGRRQLTLSRAAGLHQSVPVCPSPASPGCSWFASRSALTRRVAVAGPSWRLCLDWTRTRVRETSRSSTRHPSSPERAPRQVSPHSQTPWRGLQQD